MSCVLNEKNYFNTDQFICNLASAELKFWIILLRKNAATVHILFQIVTFMKLNQLLKNIGLTQPLHRIQYLKFAVEMFKIGKF